MNNFVEINFDFRKISLIFLCCYFSKAIHVNFGVIISSKLGQNMNN